MNDRIRFRHSILNKSIEEQYKIIYRKNDAQLLKHELLDIATNEYLLLFRVGCLLLSLFKKLKCYPRLMKWI